MSYADLRLYPVSIDAMMKVAEAVDFLGDASASQVQQFAGTGSTTTYKSLVNLSHLQVTDRRVGGTHTLAYGSTLRGTSRQEKSLVFRQVLQSYEPFKCLCQFLVYGDDESSACRKAAVVLGKPELQRVALPALVRWGIDVGVVRRDASGQLALSQSLERALEAVGEAFEEKLSNRFEIELYLAKRLTAACYEFLEEPERERIVQAFVNSHDNPEKSCEESGKALENFLRLLAIRAGVDVSTRNGISQIAEELTKHGAVHSKHKNICLGLGAVRTVSAHDRDRHSNNPWGKTPEMAFAALAFTLCLMRSIYLWAFEGKQVL